MIFACLPGILRSARILPLENSDLIAEKYAGWSGVLRIWAFEGWTGGEISAGWIARCAAAFEKSHPSVYIEVIYPGVEAVAQLGRQGVRAPDLILFPPGLLDSVAGLAPVGELPVRGSLLGAGQGFAAPVALGGYAWAINGEADGIGIPSAEEFRDWTAAAAHLGTPDASIEETVPEPPGIDLGLPASAQQDSPIESFIAGRLGAACVTQREIARLSRLSDQGRGPEWTLSPGAQAWTDQVLYMAVVAGGETQALSLELIHHLLSGESQQQLAKSNLLTVLDAPTGYAAGSAMELLDLSLHREGLQVPPAFAIRP